MPYLSLQRALKGEAKSRDGSICTEKPSEIWGTDATWPQTVEEGTVWVFAAVEPVKHGVRKLFNPAFMAPASFHLVAQGRT